MTDVKIVDASALCAVLFDEPEAEAVAARLRGTNLVAPVLLGFEVGNTCLKKIRRHRDQRTAMLTGFAKFQDLSIELTEIDAGGVLALAEASGLTFYDAAYLWLAQRLACELVTLDGLLHAAWSARPAPT